MGPHCIMQEEAEANEPEEVSMQVNKIAHVNFSQPIVYLTLTGLTGPL